MYRFAISLSVVAALAMPACGGDEAPSTKPVSTAADTGATTVSREEDERRATDALLGLADLGSEWQGYDLAQDPVVAAEINCFVRVDDTNLVVTAREPGDVFSSGSPVTIVAGKVFPRGSHVVTSSVLVFETEGQAQRAFRRTVDVLHGRPVLRCLSIADTVPKGPRMVSVQGFRYQPDKVPMLAEETYVQQYETRIEKKAGAVWLDFVLMRDERALGFALFSSVELPGFIDPLSDEFVTSTAGIMGKRLAP